MAFKTREERFFEKVVLLPNQCWLWVGSRDHGYGQFWDGASNARAHRWGYQRWVGSIPKGLQLDHLCRNPGCVNPAHLEPVTASENTLRERDLRVTCPRGHSKAGYNLVVNSRGARGCRMCQVAATRTWRRNQKRSA